MMHTKYRTGDRRNSVAWWGMVLVCAAPALARGADDAPVLDVRVLSEEAIVFGRVELEIAVKGVPPAANPFDPDEIAVDAEVTSPSGAVQKVPGFFYAGYDRKLQGGREVLTRSGADGFRVRFAPLEAGQFRVAVTVRLAGKPAGAGATTVVARSGSRGGFVRVEPKQKRYFVRDDGMPLFLVGLCSCWHDERGTHDYDDWLPAYEKAGINYIRIWMWHHAFGIEFDRGDRTRYRLDRAWTLDRVLGEADRHGIQVMLCFDYHGILEVKPDFWKSNNEWPKHPYNVENGGPCRSQNEFFTSEEARKLYRKRLRYMVGRWGAFSNILAWQFFNEIDNVYRYLQPGDVASWHRDMARELRAMDPYGHLITTSLTGKSERPEIWEIKELDFAQYHSYNQEHPADVTADVVRRFHERYGKPVFVGEYGTDFRGWKPDTDPDLRALHQAIWSGAFTGAAGTGMSWWWQSLHQAGRYSSWSSLSGFLRGTRIGDAALAPAAIEVTGDAKAFGVSDGRDTLLWVLDSRYSWPAGALEAAPAPCEGVGLRLGGLAEGAYRLEWWDPSAAKVAREEEIRAGADGLRLVVPSFRVDAAARIRRS